MTSHQAIKQSEPDPPREVFFAPGECERVLVTLGFDDVKLRDNGYFVRAVEAVGDTDELHRLMMMFRQLVELPRPKLMAELMSRMTSKAWVQFRDQACYMDVADLARDVVRAECRRRHGFLIAEMVGMA